MEAKLKRNVILVGHAHSGKTSLAECLLFSTGATTRKGDVMKGNSVSDFNDDEIERQCSINSSFLKTTFQSHQIQIIDSPGYLDFIGETISSISAADAAIVVVDATHGVEVGTEDIWQRLEEMQIPRIIFINKTDKSEANVDSCVSDINECLSRSAKILDLDSVELMESVAETDDQLLEKYLEAGTLSKDEVGHALRKSVIESKFFPILQGSAANDLGVSELLEAIVALCPSPVEHPAFQVRDSVTKELKSIMPQEDAPFSGFVFKSMFDPHLGQLSLVKVLSGSINANSDCFNANASKKEHVSTINMLQGKEQISVTQASCGDIIALPKLKNTHVCDSFCDSKERFSFEPIQFPEPAISASIRPKTRADEDKISSSLSRLCEEDHTVQVKRDEETKELILSGVGDLHLKVILDRLKQRYNVNVDLGTPKVAYRETIRKTARARYKYKKQSGGRGQYGDVELLIEPLTGEDEEYKFVNKIFGGAIPKNYIPSVEKGVKKTIAEGVLAGYQMINVRVTVVDGSYHDVDSSDMAFQIAGALAMKDTVKQADPVLLEPIMEVSVTVPDEFIGQVTGDLSSRRGKIQGAEAKGKKEIIRVNIPLSEMFKYPNDLRSMTGGRGSYSMKFSHYEQAPARVTEQIIAQKQQQQQ